MATVLISGGSGMLGTALTKELVRKGHEVIILTRQAGKDGPVKNIQYATWDPAAGTIDREAFGKADHIVHLAGANLAEGRWTDKRKKEIRDSRVQSGALLVQSLREIPNKIKSVVSSSAIGYYGPDPAMNKPAFTETDPPVNDFLGSVVQDWEKAISPAGQVGRRLVIFRIGIILSKQGGAYVEFVKPLKFGIASVLGSGKQMVSWIHIQDVVNLFITALENESWQGVYNAVAPEPVTNRVLIQAIARAKGGFSILAPVPVFVLKAMLGEMSVEVLKSTTVSNGKLNAMGYQFLFPDIQSAVKDLRF
jgi:uncharacterized protein (TIGR01777 family)